MFMSVQLVLLEVLLTQSSLDLSLKLVYDGSAIGLNWNAIYRELNII